MDDTIAAITTAPGEAGIAIVRLSGPQALAIGDAVYKGRTALSAMRANTFAYGRVVADRDAGNVLDEVIVLVYRAPRSYTCEDVVEIQSHGGSIAARRILRAVISHGARLAEPGEFTRRAFLNGRLDLLQAEAVADLIRARSDRAADAAVEQLSGRLSNAFNEIYDGLIILAADIEATLDFVEEELPEATMLDLAARLSTVRGALDALLATWEEGHLLRDGALVVISGQPNVGKSTLMNALLGKDRAIVTDVAGTTRDTIEEQMILDGVPLRLVDTAGIREVDCVVEREGIRRARASINSADINIHVVDGSAPVAGQDLDMIGQLDPARTIVILNKTDLGSQAKLEMIDPAILTCACSLLTRDGAGDVVKALRTKLHAGQGAPPHAVISERHRMLADDALASVCTAAEWLARASGDAPVFAGQALREALEALGTVTGRAYSDELLDTIFSRFCVGK